eukprot:scaffold86937_cov31-Tisochrysis_lutea.AAC.4
MADEKRRSNAPRSPPAASVSNFSALRPRYVTPKRAGFRPSRSGDKSSMPCLAIPRADGSRSGARRDRIVSRERLHITTRVVAWRPCSLA